MKFSIFQTNKSKSDEELAELFTKSGDMAIVGELYNRYLEMLLGVSLKYLKNTEESEDAVMEIFEIIVKRLPNHEVENFKAWLYRVASNHCLDILRKQKRTREKENELIHMYSSDTIRQEEGWMSEEIADNEALLSLMEKCIETLNSSQKETIKLFYLERKSYEEVAEKLDITWSQTRSYVQNGRRNIKKCMETTHEASR